MKINYFCSMWGMTHPTLEANFRAIKEAGFDGVEMATPRDAERRKEVKALLAEFGLQLNLLQYSTGANAKEHADDLAQLLHFAKELNPALINSQSSKDFYPIKETVRIIKATNKVAAKLGLSVVHETHRIRAMYTLPSTIAILDAIPDLRINADLSHFCVVHESYLQDQLPALNRVLERCYYIHARVGHPEGPQVSDPRAPEWQQAVDYHVGWWQQIVDARKAEGLPAMAICTEFGTPNYMPAQPYTRQPVANLWEINTWMMRALKERLKAD